MRKILLVLLPMLFSIQLTAQFYGGSKYTGIGLPYFDVDVFRTLSDNPEKLRVYIFCEILNDDLTFIKDDTSGYIAEYECWAAIYNQDEIQGDSKVIKKNIRETAYELTNSRENKLALTFIFDLDPGKYVVKMRSNDLIFLLIY